MAENKDGLGDRPYHKGASYSRFVFISETKCSDWFALFVANPELRKAAFGHVHFNWCKLVSHFSEACTGNAPLKFQGEEPILRRSDDTRWYSGQRRKLQGWLKTNSASFALVRRSCPQDLLGQVTQKIRLQIEFSAVGSALSGRNPCPCGARVLPPIPSGLARYGDRSIDENELADRYPLANDSGGERSKRLSNEGDVCPLSNFPDHDLSIFFQTCAFVVARQVNGDRFTLNLLE